MYSSPYAVTIWHAKGDKEKLLNITTYMKESSRCAPREIRFRWYRQVEAYGKPVPEVCDIFGISRKTYYKWYRRDHGLGPSQYKARAIHPHTKLTPEIKVAVVGAKLQLNYGPQKMHDYLIQRHGVSVCPSVLYRFFKKKRLIRKPQRKQRWYTPMKEPYRASIPGENVQLDVKYVPGRESSWEYQYRFIDTVTNMQYAVDMEAKDARATIVALRGAVRSLPFPVLGIQTDNGSEFRGVFHVYLVRHGIAHRYIPKRSAPWNGKVERANRSVDDEFYLNSNRPWNTLREYTRWYNRERPHLGRDMNGMTPHQKFLSLSTPQLSPLKGN